MTEDKQETQSAETHLEKQLALIKRKACQGIPSLKADHHSIDSPASVYDDEHHESSRRQYTSFSRQLCFDVQQYVPQYLLPDKADSPSEKPKATILTTPAELQLLILKSADRVTSTCLGLSCKAFYAMHWELHGKVPLATFSLLKFTPNTTAKQHGNHLIELLGEWMRNGKVPIFYKPLQIFISREAMTQIEEHLRLCGYPRGERSDVGKRVAARVWDNALDWEMHREMWRLGYNRFFGGAWVLHVPGGPCICGRCRLLRLKEILISRRFGV